MTLTSHLAHVSSKVSASSARKAKVLALADALREFHGGRLVVHAAALRRQLAPGA